VWATAYHPTFAALSSAGRQYFAPANFSFGALVANWRAFLCSAAAALGLAALARRAGGRLAALLALRSGPLPATALGAGALGLAVLGAGLAGLLLPVPRRPALVALAALAALDLPVWIRHRPAWTALPVSRPTRWALLAVVLITAFGVFNIEMGWDALSYHLRLPSIALVHHRITDVWHHYCSPFPALIEMLFTLGLLARDDQAARILNALLGLGLLGALGRLADEAGVRRGWPLALCLASPVVPLLGMRAYVDLGVALFVTLALAELLRYRRTGAVPSLLASGLCAGCAMGAKYTAVFVVPAGLLLLAAGAGRRTGRGTLAAWLTAAALPVLPWLAKNVALKGNPVSPLLGGIFGTAEVIPGDITPLAEAARGPAALVHAAAAHATALIYNHGRIDGPVACTIAGLLPLVFLTPGTAPLAALRGAALAWGAAWLVLAPDARFFLPILPAICVLESAGLAELLRRAGHLRRALTGSVEAGLILGAAHAVFIQWVFFAPFGLALGFDTRAGKLAVGLQPPPFNWYLTGWLNDHVPAGDRIWFVSDFSTYYVRRECLADFHFGRSQFTRLMAEAPTAEALAVRLRQRGFRWICSTGQLQAQYLGTAGYFDAPPAAWGELKRFLTTRTDVAFEAENYTVFRVVRPHVPRPLPDLPVATTLAFHAADVAMDAGRYAEALAGYRAFPPLLADVAATWVRQGDACMMLGDSRAALAAFLRARALGCDNARVHAGIGNVLLRLGRGGEALAHNEASWRLNPLSANAAATLAVNLNLLGRTDDARRLIREAIRLAPDEPDYRAMAASIGSTP